MNMLKMLIASKMMGGGSGGASVTEKDVNFYDYDGTLLHSYTVAEAQALTELPPLPEQPGLICQGWNWTLEDIKEHNRAVNVGAMYITNDGTTRLYIHLEDGRTSPVLCIAVNGTVTVDWGDGTASDVLTGTSTGVMLYTPKHEYAKPGDYVIRLTVDGKVGGVYNQGRGFLRASQSDSQDNINNVYMNAIHRVEIGTGLKSITNRFFEGCRSLESISIPDGVERVNDLAFDQCYSLACVVLPKSVTTLGGSSGDVFSACYSLKRIMLPVGVKTIAKRLFYDCRSLDSVVIPNGVTTIGESAFYCCYSLEKIVIPDGVISIAKDVFRANKSLASIVIPNGVTMDGITAFYSCDSLVFAVIPNSITTIKDNMFYGCYGMRYYDFSKHTFVPTLSYSSAIHVPDDCEIRVPAALYDEWIAATNWSTYASKIVAV